MRLLKQLTNLMPFDREADSSEDDDFLDRYRTLLFGHYRSLDLSNPANVSAKREADSILEKNRKATWEDLYRLETMIIELEPSEALLRHAWILRSEYEEICTADEKKEYKDSKPPEGSGGNDAIALLRADLRRIQEEVHWHYIALWAFEDFRAKVLKRAIWLTVIALGGIAMLLAGAADYCARHWHLNLNVALPILAAGGLGGLISNLRRTYSMKLSGNADDALTKLDGNPLSIAVPPLLGCIFAGVLYLLFVSTAIQGALFPKATIGWLSTYPQPVPPTLDGQEFAKLLIWSFVAGFMETFVPDRLKSLVSSDES